MYRVLPRDLQFSRLPPAVICHAFAKSRDGAGNQAIRVAQFFNCIRYVDPETGVPSVTSKKP